MMWTVGLRKARLEVMMLQPVFIVGALEALCGK